MDSQSNIGKKAVKAGLWYTVCTFILKAISFITTPVFTRMMSSADIGIYSTFATWVSILGSIITLDLFTSINLAHFSFNDEIDRYMSTIAIAGSVFTISIYLAFFPIHNQILTFLGISEGMYNIMFVYFLVYPAIQILHAKYRIYLQYKETIITSLVPMGISVILAVGAVLLFPNARLEARIIGYYGSWILFSCVIYLYIIFKGKGFDLKYVKFALPISIPLIVHTLSNTVLSMSDRIMINRICGPLDTAYYTIAYSCALVLSVLWSAINQAWAPWCYEMMSKEDYVNISRKAKPIVSLFCIIVLLSILIAPELLLLMGGKEYASAVYVIPPVMLGYIAQMLYTLYVNIEYFHKKQKLIMTGTVIAAVINIILNAVFIPRYGYIAAAYTTLFGYILLLLIHFLFVKKIKMDRIYDIKFNIGIMIISCFTTLLATFLYSLFYLRWLTILVIVIVISLPAIKNRRLVIRALKNKDFSEIGSLTLEMYKRK